MSLITEYRRQFAWRDWGRALSLCPIVPGQRVLDLGCGPGDVSRLLAKRGAVVTGVDNNPDLLEFARSEQSPGCTFIQQDLRSIDLGAEKFDGLWASFTPAYFCDFKKVFEKWTSLLNERAWVCLIEVDDLLGHEPLEAQTQELIVQFYRDALSGGRYDFNMGRKLRSNLESLGFNVITENLKDRELSFDGPASADVLEAWSDRFDRMGGLKTFLGSRFNSFRNGYLDCLASEIHRSTCKVVSCVGTRVV